MSPIRRVAFELTLLSSFLSATVCAEPSTPPAAPAVPLGDAVATAEEPATPSAPNAAEPSVANSAPTTIDPTSVALAPPATPAPVSSVPALAPARLKKSTLGWDLNLEGAYGRFYGDPAERFGFARVRAGLLYSVDPIYYALGLTYDWSNLTSATFGVQAEAMHIESGLWLQAGALVDVQSHPGVMASLGWSVFGAEVQYRKFDPSDWGMVVVGKLRIPVTFIAKAFE